MVNDAVATNAQQPRRLAVVVVHGVRPHPRYATQDELGEQLAKALNRTAGATTAKGPWRSSVTYPQNQSEGTLPTITRVSRQSPNSDIYDVIEAYWSPLTKHKASAFSVLSWLYRNVLVPANTDARLETPPPKMAFDLAYVGGAVLLAVAFLTIASVLLVYCGLRVFGLAQPSALGADWARLIVVSLATALDALFSVTVIQAIWSGFRSISDASPVPERGPHRRWGAIAVLLLTGLGGIAAVSFVPLPIGGTFGVQWEIALATLLMVLARALVVDFLVSFFGDVEVYSSRDENDEYYMARSRVVHIAREAIASAIADRPFGQERSYDRVVVMGHSLGSVIAMDAIIALHHAHKEGAVPSSSWERLRSLVTYGTALEKARYFFDASMKVTLSSSFLAWRDEIYGPLFSAKREVLDGPPGSGIHWSNYWYLPDPVANPIESYRSILDVHERLDQLPDIEMQLRQELPGDDSLERRLVCQNVELKSSFSPQHLMVHGDYVYDTNFWSGVNGDRNTSVLDILERDAHERTVLLTALAPQDRVEVVSKRAARAARRPFRV